VPASFATVQDGRAVRDGLASSPAQMRR
jgi:hypothetical protein